MYACVHVWLEAGRLLSLWFPQSQNVTGSLSDRRSLCCCVWDFSFFQGSYGRRVREWVLLLAWLFLTCLPSPHLSLLSQPEALWKAEGWVRSEYQAGFLAPSAVSHNIPPSPRRFAGDCWFPQSSCDRGKPSVWQWWHQCHPFGWYHCVTHWSSPVCLGEAGAPGAPPAGQLWTCHGCVHVPLPAPHNGLSIVSPPAVWPQ